MNKGLYVVFEGIVATGKTTLSKQLASELTKKFPNKEVIWVREPGTGEIAESIRTLVQGTRFSEQMHPIAEAYLYAASRAQVLPTRAKPVLDKGGIVISDRSFITSLAFQAHGRELGIQKVLEINRPIIEGMWPDLVFYLDVDASIALQRVFDTDGDKFERQTEDFFENVRKGYKEVSKLPELKDKWIALTADKTPDKIHELFSHVLDVTLKRISS